MGQYATAEDLKNSGRLTPMMEQYLAAKAQNPDAILFFRLGDFYEMFFEDALVASELLELTLTSRDKSDDPVPMCGIPHHSSRGYIAKLVASGRKVAICEQVEDPALAKKLVRREVVQVVTPGLVSDTELLEPRLPRYLMCVALFDQPPYGFAYLDASTGEFRLGVAPDRATLAEEVGRVAPHEIIVSGLPAGEKAEDFYCQPGVRVEAGRVAPTPEAAAGRLAAHWGLKSLAGLELEGLGPGFSAGALALDYVKANLAIALPNLSVPARHPTSGVMYVGETTLKNLEIFQTLSGERRKSTLLSLMDRTKTPMGGRELRRRVAYPLLDPALIEARLDAVAELATRGETRRKLREELRRVGDLARLSGKVVMHTANARDMNALAGGLAALPAIKALCSDADSTLIREDGEQLDPLPELFDLIRRAIAPEPPATLTDGGLIADGFDPAIDELRAIGAGGRSWIANLQAAERERTGIQGLKIGFNRVFGYYIEVSRTRSSQVPENYERRQTLANAERYVTPELKEIEAKVLGAEERLSALERQVFMSIVEAAATHAGALRATSLALSRLDVNSSLAELAVERRFVRPRVDDGYDFRIVGGRHPVVEASLVGERFVPNDVTFDRGSNRLLVITGPNMSGKSTILRQTAIIALMAQVGSFVPAQSAHLGAVDRIFTRVGASDDIAAGRSTFMVEMIETAAVLANATPRSLLILDEIGRGTSTFDGLSIAWAVAEFIHDLGSRTLFATHYHELTDLARTLSGVANFNVAVKQWQGSIIFLRRLIEGAVNRSYGIEVAKLAGLPPKVLARAATVLENLQSGELDETGQPRFALGMGQPRHPSKVQPDLFLGAADVRRDRFIEELSSLTVEELTPLEALIRLADIKSRALGFAREDEK